MPPETSAMPPFDDIVKSADPAPEIVDTTTEIDQDVQDIVGDPHVQQLEGRYTFLVVKLLDRHQLIKRQLGLAFYIYIVFMCLVQVLTWLDYTTQSPIVTWVIWIFVLYWPTFLSYLYIRFG